MKTSNPARRRLRRSAHLPMHKRPKFATVEQVNSHTQRWTFRPRCLGVNEIPKRWKFHHEKVAWRTAVRTCLRNLREPLLPLRKPCRISFAYFEANSLRDLDNIAGGARKCILDALVMNGVLGDDGWAWITDLQDSGFSVDKLDPRVIVTIVGRP